MPRFIDGNIAILPLQSRLTMALPSTLIFDYPTLSALQQFLSTKASEQQQQQQLTHPMGKGKAQQVVRSAAKLPPAVPGTASLRKPAAIQPSTLTAWVMLPYLVV
eukprot:1155414-Pelagomonas_calceolata.AAC.5